MPVFVLDLAGLKQGFSQLRLEGAPADVELGGPDWLGPVRADLACDRSGDQVAIRGTVAAVARFECARCLAAFERSLVGEFSLFSDRQGVGRRGEDAELERGDYMVFHDGRQLDLRQAAQESLLLEWPMAPLCREDCRGLCPGCGADLNLGPCGCGSG